MNRWEKTLKWLTKISYGLLLFILINILVARINPIEFRDVDLKSEYELILMLATPLIVFLLVILDYLKNQEKRIFTLNFILGIPLSIISFIIIILMAQSIDMSRGSERVLFENRFDKKQRIVYRSSYWDGNRSEGETYHLKTLNKFFQLTLRTDTTELNPYQWIDLKKGLKN
ncbi:hypothetical protein [Roseivirga sp.]|uniref:hypothetical protein n=1 Tax=Roseivirga sp. TaxID=1964215 RepID=UPI003B8AE283